MDVLFFLLPISILILIIGVSCFFWAIRSDQYNDLDRPAKDILLDDAKDNQSNVKFYDS